MIDFKKKENGIFGLIVGSANSGKSKTLIGVAKDAARDLEDATIGIITDSNDGLSFMYEGPFTNLYVRPKFDDMNYFENLWLTINKVDVLFIDNINYFMSCFTDPNTFTGTLHDKYDQVIAFLKSITVNKNIPIICTMQSNANGYYDNRFCYKFTHVIVSTFNNGTICGTTVKDYYDHRNIGVTEQMN